MSINRVVITGDVTRDAELRMSQSGTGILTVPVATNGRRKNAQSGEWEDAPVYVDVAVAGKRALALADRLRKGTRVAVEGHLRWSQWERDGQRRSKLDVVADELEFLGPRDAG